MAGKSDDPLMLGGLPDVDAVATSSKTTGKQRAAEERLEVQAANAATNAKKEARMSQPKPPPASKAPLPPPPPPPPSLTQDAKSKLIDKIMAYRTRFPSLSSRNKISMKASDEELQDELHYYSVQLGDSSQSKQGMAIFLAVVAGIEKGTAEYWNPLNLDLTGMARVASDNPSEFENIVDELIIKYGASKPMGPEMRLALALGTLMYTVNAANQGNEKVKAALEKVNKTVVVGGA